MKTYPTYAKAKIDNPGYKIFTDGIAFYCALEGCIGKVITECNPVDHCSTVEEFLDAGYKFEVGDYYLTATGEVVKVDTCIRAHNCNLGNYHRSVRFILQSEALNGGSKIPEKKVAEEDEWTPELGSIVHSVNHMGSGECLAVWFDKYNNTNVVAWDNGDTIYNGTPIKYMRPGKSQEEIDAEKITEVAYVMYQADCTKGSIKIKSHSEVKDKRFFENYIAMAKAAIKHIKGE